MIRIWAAALTVALVLGSWPLAAAERITDPRIGALFAKHKVEGVLVLFDPAADRLYSNDFDRAARRFLPASTFKIPHTLIALETGAVSGASEVFRWDGRKRGVDVWNRDQTLATALAHSAVWTYQVIARRIGRARMAEWVAKLEFGNGDISGPIDSFWLDGALRISALEQIAWLRRLHAGDLPVSERALTEVKRLLVVEETDHYVLRAKTGWAQHPDPDIGWYVGWIKAGSRIMFFTLNIDMPHPETDRYARIQAAWEGLELYGIDILP